MIGRLFAVVGLLGVASAGGMVWLLVRGERRHSRAARARALRALAWGSALVVLATVAFLRPWYWDLAIAAVVALGLVALHAVLPSLVRLASPAPARSIVLALVAVVVGSAIVTLGGTAAVLDGAALVGGRPVPVPHDGQVLATPVLYQVFWGPAWGGGVTPPALRQAVAFERTLGSSAWTTSVERAGFGVRSLRAGGCWVDPGAPPGAAQASSTATGPFATEVHRVFARQRRLRPCPGMAARAVPRRLPADAVVALWLDPRLAYGLGGVSAHGAVPWAGRPDGVAAAGFTGGFAAWGTAACARQPSCAALSGVASPAYALSHEVVEAATNPFGAGWYADPPVRWSARYFLSHGPTSMLGTAPVFQGEVADLCEPGQPDAPRRPAAAAPGDDGLTLAPFYRPGVGCS